MIKRLYFDILYFWNREKEQYMAGQNNYTNSDMAYNRLKNEYDTHGKLIIAFDFDNTIYDCHFKGLQLECAVTAIKKAHDLGNEVYCFTANNDHDLVRKHSLEVLGFTPNINESSLDYMFESRKPFYSLLLDDRAGLDTSLRLLNTLNFYIHNRLK